jgi:hypothetical protein
LNKWSVTIGLGALILGTLMWTAYPVVGWHYFDMPHINIIVSIFHFDGVRLGWNMSRLLRFS